jgi:diguanylate cyclase
VFAAGIVLALMCTGFLVSLVLNPLLELIRFARAMAVSNDYSQRVTVTREDELGVLGRAVNEMMNAIGSRDQRISGLALTDPESGLPNRVALLDAINAAIKTRSEDEAFIVAAFSIERFSEVRSAIGYSHANKVVAAIGDRILESMEVRAVGRLSSDVIGVLVAADTLVDCRLAAFRLIDQCAQPLRIEGYAVDATIRVGYAPLDESDPSPVRLVEQAGIALDQARAGQRKFGAYDADAYGDPTKTLSLMSDMHAAIKSGTLTMHLQPKLDIRSGRMLDAEALARWHDPDRGYVAPDLFIGLAEETGAIRYLSEWAVDLAVDQCVEVARISPGFSIAVNISGKLLCDIGFVRRALARISERGAKIAFEITETAVIHDPDAALRSLAILAEAGISIAIDDYGVGLSSLEYLKRIAADELKIDKSYILGMDHSRRDAVIVSSTVQLAHSLGMKVTAEGVESETVLAALAALGCDKAQGFHVARPMPVEALVSLLGQPPALATQPANRLTASAAP